MDLGVIGSRGLAFPGISYTSRTTGTGVALSDSSTQDQREGQRFPKAQPTGPEQLLARAGSGPWGNGALAGVPACGGLALRLLFWVWHELFSTEQPSLEFLGLSPRLGERSGVEVLSSQRRLYLVPLCPRLPICTGWCCRSGP